MDRTIDPSDSIVPGGSGRYRREVRHALARHAIDSGSALDRLLARRVPERIARFGEPLRDHVSWRVGGPARVFLAPSSVDEARAALEATRRLGFPIFVLGGGTNVLPPPEGFDGAVVATRGIRKLGADDPAGEDGRLGRYGLRVCAGASLMHVIRRAARLGLAGIETLAGIPGTVGGATTMNTGGPAGTPSFGERVRRALVLEPEAVAPRWLEQRDLAFRYRGSAVLDGGLLVLAVDLELAPDDAGAIQERIVASMMKKRSSQPIWCRSAGCTFRNPPKPSPGAGALIDRSGCKGLQVGGAAVSDVHANFLVNAGGATAADVVGLIAAVRTRVQERFGVWLETEIRRI